MTRKITFIHAADLHFGAPTRGFSSLSPEWEARLIESIPEAYDRVIDAALAHDVDFVIMAGDEFDTARASYRDFMHFLDGLARLDAAGIPTYLIAGNHDPFTTWSDVVGALPPSAHFIGGEAPEFRLYDRDGEPLCLVGGRGYRNQSWPIDEPIAAGISRRAAVKALELANPRAAEAPFMVGVIHTALNPDQSKAYSDVGFLLSADVDYWACGHLHERRVLPSQGDPRIVFPGCIQGRDLKESESRGCYLVAIEEAAGASRPRVSLEFIPTASVVFHTIKADVARCKTIADVGQFVQSQLFHENGHDHCENMVVRIVLEGQTDLHEYLNKPDVLANIRKRINDAYPTFYCDELVDRTTPKRDRASMKREGLFTAQVLGVSDEQLADDDMVVNYVQDEFVKRGIGVPSSLSHHISDYGIRAETIVLDLLEEESE